MKKRWILYLLATLLAACEGNKEASVRIAISDTDLMEKKVRYILDEKYYAIPLGYHWWDHVKYSQWPYPKEGFTKVGAITLFALLPDLEPYSSATKNEFDQKVGLGNIVDILVEESYRRSKPLADIMRDKGNRLELIDRESSYAVGLLHYVDKGISTTAPEDWIDIYIPEINLGFDFWIECKRTGISRPCVVTESHSDFPYLTYTFSIDHLSQWRRIHDGVISLLEKYEVNPQKKAEK